MSTSFLVEDLHKKAWGHKWPQHTGTILRTDVVPASQLIDDNAMDLDQDDRPVVVGDVYSGGAINIPERFDYVCLQGMLQVAEALGLATHVQDILMVRYEYVMLRDALSKIPMKRQTIGIVVTGQPGIGSYGSQFDPELNADFCFLLCQERLSSSYSFFCIVWSTNFRRWSNSVL